MRRIHFQAFIMLSSAFEIKCILSKMFCVVPGMQTVLDLVFFKSALMRFDIIDKKLAQRSKGNDKVVFNETVHLMILYPWGHTDLLLHITRNGYSLSWGSNISYYCSECLYFLHIVNRLCFLRTVTCHRWLICSEN